MVNNTGRVRFRNSSVSGKTYEILWNGIKIDVLGAGETSGYIAANAGQHYVVFRVANSSDNACTPANVDVIQCQPKTLTCST